MLILEKNSRILTFDKKKFKKVKDGNVLISEKCFMYINILVLKWLQDYCPIMIRKPL